MKIQYTSLYLTTGVKNNNRIFAMTNWTINKSRYSSNYLGRKATPTNLVMHEFAFQDDQLLFGESGLLSLLPKLVQLLVLEQTSPEILFSIRYNFAVT